MNARGIPAQSEAENLEKEYSYTLNEMTGERVPYGGKPKHPVEVSPPTGDAQSAAASTTETTQSSGESTKRSSSTPRKSSE